MLFRSEDIDDFAFAKDAANRCIRELNDETEVALLSLSNISCLEYDFTFNRNEVTNAIDEFQVSNVQQFLFVNLFKGLTSEHISGISVLQDIPERNKTILLVTQGIISFDETELIIAKANQHNIKINILYISDNVPVNIQRIADETGGFCVNKSMIDKAKLPILTTIAKLCEWFSPYHIISRCNLNCSGEYHYELTTTSFGKDEFLDHKDEKQNSLLTCSPASLEFPSVKPFTTSTQFVTLTSRNTGIMITSITTDNPSSFEVLSVTPSVPIFVSRDESLTIEIRFSPTDSAISFCRLLVASDACVYDTLFITGGFPNVKPDPPTIRLTAPRCNDVLVFGDTVDIN